VIHLISYYAYTIVPRVCTLVPFILISATLVINADSATF
jgi:hypothetical protein